MDISAISASGFRPRAVLVSGLTAALGDGGPTRAVVALARLARERGLRLVVGSLGDTEGLPDAPTGDRLVAGLRPPRAKPAR